MLGGVKRGEEKIEMGVREVTVLLRFLNPCSSQIYFLIIELFSFSIYNIKYVFLFITS
jgi:hypothetical protein